jgi:O-antigen ligase
MLGKMDLDTLNDKILLILVALVPLLSLVGNAVADITIVFLTLVFWVSTYSHWSTFTQSRFLQLSFLFWIWIVICSILSKFPLHSFQDSLPWIRFPLYAFALSQIFFSPKSIFWRVFLAAAIAGTVIEVSILTYEFIQSNFQVARLYGTFSKFIPGWYLSCFGLIANLTLIQALRTKEQTIYINIMSLAFFVLTVFAILITGEIMSTVVFLGTISLFLVARPFEGKNSLIFIMGSAVTIISLLIAVVWINPPLYKRLLVSAFKRLPWMQTSDYHPPWTAGITTALENPFIGVGPKNFNLYCLNLKEAGIMENTLHIDRCEWHPHNLYLQIFSETGIIGIILFGLIAATLFATAYRHSVLTRWKDNIPLILTFILFFPIQTYSQAFGQSKNFFFWTMIGFILAKIRQVVDRSGREMPNINAL